MRKIIIFTIIIICCSCLKHNNIYNSSSIEESEVLEIANDTAIKVYGYKTIKQEYPLKAKLIGDTVWIVTGTLPAGFAGGTVYVEIMKSNKKVIEITHYK